MGNYVSCALAAAPLGSKAPKVILPSGEVRQLCGPHNAATTAADLMLDCPGHFLVDSRSLHVGRRFSPLAADEDLEPGHAYAMFPMARVNAVVAAADMARLLAAANKAARRASGAGARVIPDVAGPAAPEPMPELKPDDVEYSSPYRRSMCRSRRPMLETISEEGVVCSQ